MFKKIINILNYNKIYDFDVYCISLCDIGYYKFMFIIIIKDC